MGCRQGESGEQGLACKKTKDLLSVPALRVLHNRGCRIVFYSNRKPTENAKKISDRLLVWKKNKKTRKESNDMMDHKFGKV